MITGIGTDILAIKSVKQKYRDMGWTLVHNILHPTEVEVFANLSSEDEDLALMYLARRLVAKEAMLKLDPNKINKLRNLIVTNGPDGRVYIAGVDLRVDEEYHLTLSDCGDYVMAVVVAERRQ